TKRDRRSLQNEPNPEEPKRAYTVLIDSRSDLQACSYCAGAQPSAGGKGRRDRGYFDSYAGPTLATASRGGLLGKVCGLLAFSMAVTAGGGGGGVQRGLGVS